jgi:hypothetical protein
MLPPKQAESIVIRASFPSPDAMKKPPAGSEARRRSKLNSGGVG